MSNNDLCNVILLAKLSEKFRCASKVTTKLVSLASEVSGANFESRLALLEYIALAWEHNKTLLLVDGKKFTYMYT